jgi:uncharacterized protein (TIGR02268 family)
MRNLSSRSVLFLVLLASAAIAKEREPQIRNVTLPDGPDEIARPIFVAATIATVLRFEKEVDTARTEMVGWKGRFEPLLVGGKKVVIEPLYDLTSEDRFPLVVTLVDGTQVPFSVQPAEAEWVDHQVNLYWDRESDQYLRAKLENALWRERLYREENERYAQEENSPDHALAALLANGAEEQTPFRAKRAYTYKEGDAEITIIVYTGKSKAAVLVRIKNHLDRFWTLREARLTSGSEFYKPSAAVRKCAMRMAPRSIAPGASGAVAIVADKKAFLSEKGLLEELALQIIRDDGLVQAFVKLDPSLAR